MTSSTLLTNSVKFEIWPFEQFEKDYEVKEAIGHGQYGEVFSAIAKQKLQKPTTVAVKFLKCKRACEKLRIRDEIDVLKTLNHDNVIKIYGAYENHDQV